MVKEEHSFVKNVAKFSKLELHMIFIIDLTLVTGLTNVANVKRTIKAALH